MAFVQVVNSGKGFITHEDQTKLSFSGGYVDLWEVNGATADINAWRTRVGGVSKTTQEATDLSTAHTNYLYTRIEFFTELVTPAQAANLFSLAVSDVEIRPFVKQILVVDSMDVRDTWFIDGIGLLLSKGHINQAKHDEILAGR